jgi:hypothetical protein
MVFTGQLGVNQSQLGNLVLGVVDSFELESVGFKLLPLSSKEVIVIFSHPMTDSVLNLDSYNLSSDLSYVPQIFGVTRHGSGFNQVVLSLSGDLTYDGSYFVQLNGVYDVEGNAATGNPQTFVSKTNVFPVPLFASLGRVGTIDISFDRPVGPYSSLALASVQDASLPGPGVSMTPTVWSAEGLPDNVIRFVFPISIPSADQYRVDLVDVSDISSNKYVGSVSFSPLSRATLPNTYSSLTSIQISDAFIYRQAPILDLLTLRIIFNIQTDHGSVTNPDNWTVQQIGPHSSSGSIDNEALSDCVDEASAVYLLNDLKSKYNLHVLRYVVHSDIDQLDIVITPDATNLSDAPELLMSIHEHFVSHINKTGVIHSYEDATLTPYLNLSTNSEIFKSINLLKKCFNSHISSYRSLDFHELVPSFVGKITDRASIGRVTYDDGPFKFFVDLNVKSNVRASSYTVSCSVNDSSFTTQTNPADVTGNISFSERISHFTTRTPNRGLQFMVGSPTVVTDFFAYSISGKSTTDVSTEPSFSDAVSSYYDLLLFYHLHITPGFTGHLIDDTTHIITSDDYPLSFDLDSVLTAFTSFKSKVFGHMPGAYHTNPGPTDFIPDPVDLQSLKFAIQSLRDAFISHNMSGSYVSPVGITPTLFGHHLFPGYPGILSTTDTRVNVNCGDFTSGTVSYCCNFPLVVFNQKTGSDGTRHSLSFGSLEVEGPRPSTSGAVFSSGIYYIVDKLGGMKRKLSQDSIEITFSEGMYRSDLVDSNFSVLPNTVRVTDFKWKDDRSILLNVSNVQKVQYEISVSGLFNKLLNPIYT